MSRKRFRSRFQQIIQTLLDGARHLIHNVNFRNFTILFKALREEPPGLILENLNRLLRSGKGQPKFGDIFFGHDEQLKVYPLACRKENGTLKVVVWIIAKNELVEAKLYENGRPLEQVLKSFSKPELAAHFSDFAGFQQLGLIFQTSTNVTLSRLGLELADQSKYKTTFPIGQKFVYPEEKKPPHSIPTSPEKLRLLLLLTDWAISKNQKIASDFSWIGHDCEKVVIATEKGSIIDFPGEESPAMVFLDNREINSFLKQQEIDYVLLLSLDNRLPGGFIPALVSFLEDYPDADIVYFDEETQGTETRFHSPVLKPAYSPEYLDAVNYFGPNFCFSKRVGEQVNWFSPADLTSGAYDFLLRAQEHTGQFYRFPGFRLRLPERHLSYYAHRAAREEQVRKDYFSPKGISVGPGLVAGSNEVIRPVSHNHLISIIIPFKDKVALLDQCLQSLVKSTKYPHFEILLISNNSVEENTFLYLNRVCNQDTRLRWLKWDEPFNYSALNNWAVSQAKGEFVLFLNNDIEVITSGWLGNMLSYLEEERVGAVGAKLLYPDGTVQHAGVVIGIGGSAAHIHKHYPDDFGGYQDRANVVQNLSACTAACLLVRRSVFEKAGGFDAQHLPIAFNDVDLCLKIREAGYRIVYTPFVKLFHHESISRGAENSPAKRKRARKEIGFFRNKWKKQIQAGDPYYHPGFSSRRGDFEIGK